MYSLEYYLTAYRQSDDFAAQIKLGHQIISEMDVIDAAREIHKVGHGTDKLRKALEYHDEWH